MEIAFIVCTYLSQVLNLKVCRHDDIHNVANASQIVCRKFNSCVQINYSVWIFLFRYESTLLYVHIWMYEYLVR
jgi:hypothetical protein